MSFDGLETQYGFLKSLKFDGIPYSDTESRKKWDIVHKMMLENELPIHRKLLKLHCAMTIKEFSKWIEKLTPDEFYIYRKESSHKFFELSRIIQKSGQNSEDRKKFVNDLYNTYLEEDIENGVKFQKETVVIKSISDILNEHGKRNQEKLS